MSSDLVRPSSPKLDDGQPLNILILDDNAEDIIEVLESVLDHDKYIFYKSPLPAHFVSKVKLECSIL